MFPYLLPIGIMVSMWYLIYGNRINILLCKTEFVEESFALFVGDSKVVKDFLTTVSIHAIVGVIEIIWICLFAYASSYDVPFMKICISFYIACSITRFIAHLIFRRKSTVNTLEWYKIALYITYAGEVCMYLVMATSDKIFLVY